MNNNTESIYESLEKIFHEPNRLSIMSALCASDKGLSFGELKETCGLTDGNLNRHLKVLEKASAINIEKAFVGAKPRTTVHLSNNGLKRFEQYLDALDEVVRKAKSAMPVSKKAETGTGYGLPVTS